MTLCTLDPTDENMTIVLQLSSVVSAIYSSADISDVTERVRGRVGFRESLWVGWVNVCCDG